MSNNKQSSVEFLIYGMASLLGEFENKPLPQERIMALFEQTKAMHKEEITQAWEKGDGQFDNVAKKMSLDYYTEAFGGNNEQQ